MKGVAQHILARGVPMLVFMGLAGACASTVRAQETLPSAQVPEQSQQFLLNRQEMDFSFFNWSVAVEPRSGAFENEPADLSENLVRGLLKLGAEATNSMAFIWDRDGDKLLLDLNRNLNFTDDPDGTFASDNPDTRSFQEFRNIHLSQPDRTGIRDALVDLGFYKYGSRLYCTAGLRSLWAGQVTLDGQDWQMGILSNPLLSRTSETETLLLRPWGDREKPFNDYTTLPEVFELPKKLFLNGQGYELKRSEIEQDGVTCVQVEFIKQQPVLGDLKISGQFIDRLSLNGDTYLVLLDRPEADVKVPVDRYAARKVRLLAGDTEASRTTGSMRAEQPLTLSEGETAVLVMGGPLTNSVTVTRRGRSLSFNYQLIGADGAAYQLERQDRSRPPEFAVYHADKKIASGKFEFG